VQAQACQISDSSDDSISKKKRQGGFAICGRVEAGKETLNTEKPEAQLPINRFTMANADQHTKKL
jgi:hypothetical protein